MVQQIRHTLILRYSRSDTLSYLGTAEQTNSHTQVFRTDTLLYLGTVEETNYPTQVQQTRHTLILRYSRTDTLSYLGTAEQTNYHTQVLRTDTLSYFGTVEQKKKYHTQVQQNRHTLILRYSRTDTLSY